MSIILLVLMNLTFIMLVYNSIREKSLSILFWISLLIFFDLPHTLEVIRSDSSLYSESILNQASLFVFTFNMLFIIMTSIYNMITINNQNTLNMFEKKEVNKRFYSYQLVLLVLSLVIWSYGLYQVNGKILGSTWTDMRNVKPLYSMAGNYLFLASVGCVFSFFYLKRKKLFLISLVVTFIFIILVKSRSNIIPVIGPFFIYFLYKSRFNIRTISRVLLIGITIIFSVFFLQQFRYIGSVENIEFDTIIEVTQETVESIAEGGGEFNLRNGFYLFLENRNNFNNFNEGNTYKRLLLLPFPSSLFEFKPNDFAFDMYNALYPSRANQGGTYHPIFYGDAYGNFGFLGFSVAFLWFFVFKTLDKILIYSRPSVTISLLAPMSLMYILVARGAIYNSIAFLFWSGLIILSLSFISRLKWN